MNTKQINFKKAIAFSLVNVGEYTNHITNKGGATYLGIKKPYTSHFKGWEIIDEKLEQYPELKSPYRNKPTRLLKLNETLKSNIELQSFVQEFYEEYYWKKIGADIIAPSSLKVAIILFDISVMQGVKRSVGTLKKYLNRYGKAGLTLNTNIDETLIKEIDKAITKSEEVIVAELLHEYLDNLIELSKYEGGQSLGIYVERIVNLRNYLRLL